MSAPVIEPARSALAGGRIEVPALDVREGDFTAAHGFYRVRSVEQVLRGRGAKRRVAYVRVALSSETTIELAPDAFLSVYRDA